jgi:2-(1,2-epoxy-1,2-dihydrophenyl)acetyl-CoA isomerase
MNSAVVLSDSPAPYVRRILVNRPEARNAIDADVRQALFDALTDARVDPRVRAVVIGGAGGIFSAGGDLPSMVGISEPAALARMRDGHRIVALLWTYPKPVVAAVERVAAGAGAGLALLADRVVMGENAGLIFPFMRLGLVPDWGLTQTVARRAGFARANRIFLSGTPVKAVDAVEAGLADIAVDDGGVMAKALEEAERMAKLPSGAFARLKFTLRNGALADPLNLADEANLQVECLTGPEFVEGYAAFREKREPLFTEIGAVQQD